jgi:hypothetical protein
MISPSEAPENGLETRGLSGWEIVFTLLAWVLTIAFLSTDFVLVELWTLGSIFGPMSEGEMGPLPEIVAYVVGVKLVVFFVIFSVAFFLLPKLRRPRALKGSWIVTGAAFCSLMTTFPAVWWVVPYVVWWYQSRG